MNKEKLETLIRNCLNRKLSVQMIDWLAPMIAEYLADNYTDRNRPMRVDLTSLSSVKAVDVESKAIYTYPVSRCPNCNKPMTLHSERKFCEHCGQALDWRI